MRAASAQSSLPGLTRQSILFAKKVLTKRMDPRVKPAGDGGFASRAAPHTEPGARPLCASAQTNMLYAEERDPGAAADFSARNGSMALVVASGESSCTASLPRGSRAVRMPGTAASASISARDFGGGSAP